mgnify:CR=1 FL=1
MKIVVLNLDAIRYKLSPGCTAYAAGALIAPVVLLTVAAALAAIVAEDDVVAVAAIVAEVAAGVIMAATPGKIKRWPT